MVSFGTGKPKNISWIVDKLTFSVDWRIGESYFTVRS